MKSSFMLFELFHAETIFRVKFRSNKYSLTDSGWILCIGSTLWMTMSMCVMFCRTVGARWIRARVSSRSSGSRWRTAGGAAPSSLTQTFYPSSVDFRMRSPATETGSGSECSAAWEKGNKSSSFIHVYHLKNTIPSQKRQVFRASLLSLTPVVVTSCFGRSQDSRIVYRLEGRCASP